METDRVVIITGAGGGIGAALVERFLTNGNTVIATVALPTTLDELADNHESAPDLVRPVVFLASPRADSMTGQTLNVEGGVFSS